MTSLTSLPAEVLLHVCREVSGADDLARLSRTCRTFKRLINGNTLLYKHLYLNLWDDPLDHPVNRKEPDWIEDLKDVAKVFKILRSQEEGPLASEKVLIVDTLAKFLNYTNSNNSNNNKDVIKAAMPEDTSRLWALLAQSSIYSRASGLVATQRTKEDWQKAQASAHLHCLYGVAQMDYRLGMNMLPYALSRVYDMRQYDERRNGWGPFVDDGSWAVDWEKLESIMIDISYNMHRLSRLDEWWISKLWSEPFLGTFPYSYIPLRPSCPHRRVAREENEEVEKKKKERRNLDEQDPYGITGTYFRIVCFLDYRALFNYNWGERRPRRIDDPMPIINEDEATRLIAMSIAVDRIEWPSDEEEERSKQMRAARRQNDTTTEEMDGELVVEAAASHSLNTRPTDHSYSTRSAEQKKKRAKRDRANKMPIVHFSGTSRAMYVDWDPNANSRIKGTVRTTPDGEVRWTTVSIFDNDEERWKSEGIQLGGLQSGRGVLGNWFDVNYDAHGPAGPTAFWKIHDDVPEPPSEEEMKNILSEPDYEAYTDFENVEDDASLEDDYDPEDDEMHRRLLDEAAELALAEVLSEE